MRCSLKAARGWTVRYRDSGRDDWRLEKWQKLDHKGFHANLMSSVFIFWVMAAGLQRQERGFCTVAVAGNARESES